MPAALGANLAPRTDHSCTLNCQKLPTWMKNTNSLQTWDNTSTTCTCLIFHVKPSRKLAGVINLRPKFPFHQHTGPGSSAVPHFNHSFIYRFERLPRKEFQKYHDSNPEHYELSRYFNEAGSQALAHNYLEIYANSHSLESENLFLVDSEILIKELRTLDLNLPIFLHSLPPDKHHALSHLEPLLNFKCWLVCLHPEVFF